MTPPVGVRCARACMQSRVCPVASGHAHAQLLLAASAAVIAGAVRRAVREAPARDRRGALELHGAAWSWRAAARASAQRVAAACQCSHGGAGARFRTAHAPHAQRTPAPPAPPHRRGLSSQLVHPELATCSGHRIVCWTGLAVQGNGARVATHSHSTRSRIPSVASSRACACACCCFCQHRHCTAVAMHRRERAKFTPR